MASIERTAYPRFKRSPTPQHLHALYTPTDEDLTFARNTAQQERSCDQTQQGGAEKGHFDAERP